MDIVTPEQLRTLLEARELVLRQRFEAMISEVTETRDLLERIDFDGRAAQARRRNPGHGTADRARRRAERRSDDSPERRAACGRSRGAGAAEQPRRTPRKRWAWPMPSRRSASNWSTTASTPRSSIERVKGASPIRCAAIGEEMFPELDRRLDQLRRHAGRRDAGPQNRQRARQQTDAIVLAMRQVLARMMELESFNEAVELLRIDHRSAGEAQRAHQAACTSRNFAIC